MHKYLVIYEEAFSHTCLCAQSLLNFLIYEENFLFFFNSVGHFQILRLKGGYSLLTLPLLTLSVGLLKYTEESSSALAHAQQPFQAADLGCISYST